MAEVAVTVLLENLSCLLVSGGDLISGAEDELQLLKNEINPLRAFFKHVANRRLEEDKIYGEKERETERQIKLVICDVTDTIDRYLIQAAAAKKKVNFFRRRRRGGLNTEPVRSLAEEVRFLREHKVKPMLGHISIDFPEMLLIGHPSDGGSEEPPQIKVVEKFPSIGQDTVVGIKDEQEMITHSLIEGTGVISIIGMPGLGKTTLARQIFQSQVIQYEFPTRIWVYVSQDLNLKDVFLNILKEVTSKDMSSTSEHELAFLVRHFLKKRRFLLVLDDVWDCGHFTAIRDALPDCDRMNSRVLITSRFKNVGRHANPARSPHMLRFLTKEESWELVQLEVFGEPDSCPELLRKIMVRITSKCGGLALAVVIIGGLLLDQISNKPSLIAVRDAWDQLFEDIRKYSIGEKEQLILMVVQLSYNRMSYGLRNLFLYLGVFPEDYEIPAATLTRLWIAEGMIQHQEGRCLEDVAEENLMHLIQRKLVIVDKVRSNGKVKTCRLHDIVRDFCISEGRQVDLFQEIRNSKEGTFDPPISGLQSHLRLCIHSNLQEFISSEPYVPRARSFLCFSKTESTLSAEDTSKIPGDVFELLRVLDIKPIRFTRFPLQLTQLFCLRYIVLSSDFRILPEVISMLRNIQTLRIHTTSRTLEIKADIWKMIQLRHLQTNASIILQKEPESHSDQELQTLTNLSPNNCTKDVFDRTRCLKKLGIRGILSLLLDGRNFDNLERLKDLENLKLLNDSHMVSPSEGRLHCLPPPEIFPPKLRSLTLSATFLNWEHMSVLGNLENLEVLKLKDNAFVGEYWEVADGSFRSLQVLQIGYTNLVIWRASSHHFPVLRRLALRNCERLEALPHGLATLRSLQEIELLCPSKTVVVSAREIEKERLQTEGKYSRVKLSIFFPPDE